MKHTNNVLEQPGLPAAKKVWSEPELALLSVKDSTKGGVIINDDGVGFS